MTFSEERGKPVGRYFFDAIWFSNVCLVSFPDMKTGRKANVRLHTAHPSGGIEETQLYINLYGKSWVWSDLGGTLDLTEVVPQSLAQYIHSNSEKSGQ